MTVVQIFVLSGLALTFIQLVCAFVVPADRGWVLFLSAVITLSQVLIVGIAIKGLS